MTSRLSLRGLKYAEFASEETHCFTATVLFDGVPVCVAHNDGHGGATSFDPLRGTSGSLFASLMEPVNAYVASLPAHVCKDMMDPHDPTKPFSYPESLEGVVDDLVAEALILKDYRRLTKTRVLFRPVDRKERGFLTVSVKGAPSVQSVLDYVAKKYPGALVLNTKPEAEAVALYRQHG